MKNTIFFVVMSVFMTHNAFGQQTDSFVDESNIWYEYGGYGGWGYFDEQRVHKTYFFDGDTLIDGIIYKKMMLNHRDTIYSSPPFIQDFFRYHSAFRQDALKVYFILADSQDEYLYADFDIAVGDTLNYYHNNSGFTVLSIDSIPFGGGYRTEYTLSGGMFYDGIGNSLGLFKDFGIGIEGGTYLNCFQQEGITQNGIYFSGAPPNCNMEVITSIEEILTDYDVVQINPNPFSEYAILNIGKKHDGDWRLTIYDVRGKIVGRRKGHFSKSTIVVEREGLPNGLYFLNLQTNSGSSQTIKVIIK